MIDYQSQFYPFIILSIEFISFIQHQSLAHIHVYHYPLTPTLVSMYPLSINPYPRTPYVFHSHYSLTPTLISMYPYPHTPYVFHSHCLLTPTLVSMYPLSINPYPCTSYVFHSHYSLTPTLVSMYPLFINPYPHTPYVFHSHCLLTPTLVLDLSSILLVTYREEVPTGGPPSFHGRLVRYTYKLTVGAQKPNCPAQIVRIPIRIITIPGNYVCMYVCMYVCICNVCMYICMSYVYVCICMSYVCMYMYVCNSACTYA